MYACWKANTSTSAQLSSTNDTLFSVLPYVSLGKNLVPDDICNSYLLQAPLDDLQHVTIPLPSAQMTDTLFSGTSKLHCTPT